MKKLVAISLVALAACSQSSGEKSEKQYEMVVRHGSSADQCEAAKRVRDAYLSDGNDTKYAEWQQKASDDCLLSRMVAGSTSRQ